MARTESVRVDRGYRLSGTLLDACRCRILCPCWVGEDPDGGEHRSVNAYHVDSGDIEGLDVTGLSFVNVVFVPGNVLLSGTWRVVRLIDARATDPQREGLLRMLRGELGGSMAALARLVGEEVAAEPVPITHDVENGAGRVSIPGILEIVVQPYRGPDGSVTTFRDGIFTTIPGSPAWVCKASRHAVDLPRYGMAWDDRDRNAIHAQWRVEHAER
jgi:hypothetical protein